MGEAGSQGHRVFIGMPVPPEVGEAIHAWALENYRSGVRLIGATEMHVTLLFFASLSDQNLKAMIELVRQADMRPMRCETGEVEAHGHNALAVRLVARLEEQTRLSDELLGLEPINPLGQLRHMLDDPERVRMRRRARHSQLPDLHVTFARLKRGEVVQGTLPQLTPMPVTLDRLALFESHLAPGGSRYEVLAEARR